MRDAAQEFCKHQITDAISTLEPEADDHSQAEQGGKHKDAWKKAEEYPT